MKAYIAPVITLAVYSNDEVCNSVSSASTNVDFTNIPNED